MRILKFLDWKEYKKRKTFYIQFGDLREYEVPDYIRKIQNQLKQPVSIDPKTGQIDLKYDPFNNPEDFYIPLRQAS